MNTQDYMTDPQGRLVPKSSVNSARLLENDIVNDLYEKADGLQNKIRDFKSLTFSELDAFIETLAEKYNTSKGGKKGNVTFTNFEGTKRIIISIQDYIAFGPELEIAKDLVDECIMKWLASGTNKEISKLVTHAFRVDNGRINVREVLRLKQIQIQDETWMKAMDAIDDAIRVDRSKKYVRFQKRSSADMHWETTALDISKL